MRFEGFYGNRHAKEILSSAIDSGRIPHAILLEGPKGSGKKTLAKLIAEACLCKSAAEKPCGKCIACVKAGNGNHPDIRVFSSGGGPRSFSVDTVRKIRSEAFVSPNEADRKVFILTDIQTMTESAQNALLKILEEPPSFLIFILTCDGKSRVLETVRSRCQMVSLAPVGEEEALTALKDQYAGTDEAKLRHAAEITGGNIGKAKAGLESDGFEKAALLIADIARALCGLNEYDLLRISGNLEKNKELTASLLEILPLFFRDAAASKYSGLPYLSGCGDAARVLGGKLTLRQIFSLTQTALKAREALDRYANNTLLLTWLFSRLWFDVHNRRYDTIRK